MKWIHIWCAESSARHPLPILGKTYLNSLDCDCVIILICISCGWTRYKTIRPRFRTVFSFAFSFVVAVVVIVVRFVTFYIYVHIVQIEYWSHSAHIRLIFINLIIISTNNIHIRSRRRHFHLNHFLIQAAYVEMARMAIDSLKYCHT